MTKTELLVVHCPSLASQPALAWTGDIRVISVSVEIWIVDTIPRTLLNLEAAAKVAAEYCVVTSEF